MEDNSYLESEMGNPYNCPKCGSENVSSVGTYFTQPNMTEAMECLQCGYEYEIEFDN